MMVLATSNGCDKMIAPKEYSPMSACEVNPKSLGKKPIARMMFLNMLAPSPRVNSFTGFTFCLLKMAL